jgi:hypothetical protein
MSDPTLLSHSSTLGRWTLQEIRDYAMFLVGGQWADLNASEQAILDRLINEVHNLRRQTVKETRRWAEDSATVVWTDGDSSVALPANFGEVIGRQIWIVDASDKPVQAVDVLHEEEFLASFVNQGRDGKPLSRWDGRDVPVARIYRVQASDLAPVLWVYPKPSGGTRFRVLYYSQANKLVNANDVLEAPVTYNFQVAYDAAIEWALARGSNEKAALLSSQRDRRERDLFGAKLTERPSRARFYDEVGYPSTRQGEPTVGFRPR